jgi:hypothetical protein
LVRLFGCFRRVEGLRKGQNEDSFGGLELGTGSLGLGRRARLGCLGGCGLVLGLIGP